MKSLARMCVGIIFLIFLTESTVAAESLHAILAEIRSRLDRTRELVMPLVLNKERIALYHYIGSKILSFQERYHLGSSLLDDVAVHLSKAFPEAQCFSRLNLEYMLRFARQYPDLHAAPEVLYLPWKHHRILLDFGPGQEQSLSAMRLSIENGWAAEQLQNHLNKTHEEVSWIGDGDDLHIPDTEAQGAAWYLARVAHGAARVWDGAGRFFASFFKGS